MDRSTTFSVTVGSLAFVVFALLLMFLAILPLSNLPGRIPGPDLVLAASLVWIIRRPETVPPLVIAAVILVQDLLTLRAPGLTAAAVLMVSEYLKARRLLTTEVPFIFEWTVAASMMACIMIGVSAVLAIFSAPGPELLPLLVQLFFTILFYPVMVGVARLIFGIGRPTHSRSANPSARP